MAVGPTIRPEVQAIAGVDIAVLSAGIKTPGRKDLVVFRLAESSQVAAVFTQNAFCAAPVQLAKAHLAAAPSRYLLINTGNANAGTGAQGDLDAQACCQRLATLQGVAVEQVLPFSTGVIGEPLPVGKIGDALPQLDAHWSKEAWLAAAEGIMTTDTRPKAGSRTFEWQGQSVRLSGIAKGSGMICPNMATMLGFFATDANIDASLLQSMLKRAADASFNRISVDGDTSTNDACVLVATGQAALTISTAEPDLLALFELHLQSLMLELAHEIIKDGEGATKFVRLRVCQAANEQEALAVAYTIAHSPLVKTALSASDANWGRILAAVGRAGLAALDLSRVNIYLDQVCIVAAGGRAPSYAEAQGAAVVAQESFEIRVELGRGSVEDSVWTTDLSYEYVRINAEYRS